MRVAFFLTTAFLASCIGEVPLGDAACPCLAGYYCGDDGVCHDNGDILSALEGKTYIVQTDRADWTEPPHLASSLDTSDFRHGYPVFGYTILEIDTLNLTFVARLGMMQEDRQNMGLKTYEMIGTLDIRNDTVVSFVLGPLDVQTILIGPEGNDGEANNTLARFYGLTFSGQYTAGGDQVEDGSLTAVMNLDEFYTLFYIPDFTSGAALCDAIGLSLDVYCGECPGKPKEPYCMAFTAENLSYPCSPNVTIEPVYNFDDKYL